MYNELFAKLILTDEHRAELKSKRGLTDETINAAILRSAGPQNIELINEFAQTTTKSRLRTLQILDGDEPSRLLLEDRVIIPYIDDQKEIDYFRCHKFGIKGRTPPVYNPPHPEVVNKRWLILAESEFKAMACSQLGFACRATPGCATHIKQHFPILQSAIEQSGITDVIILWDNEDKVSPDSPKYKPDPDSRYDVEAWEYVMAIQIAAKCKACDCNIARLPDEWRINGKADIDSCVAAGHTADEFKALFKSAMPPQDYRQTWSAECESYARKKIDRLLYRSPVSEEFGKYFTATKAGKMPVSNFTLEIKYNYLDRLGDDFELQRGIQIKDQYGSPSQVFQIDTQTLTALARFKSWVLSKGSYNFRGNQINLDNVVDLVTNFDENPVIERPMIYGWCDYLKAYILGNMAVSDKGEVFQENAAGVIPIGRRGIKAVNPDDGQPAMMRISLDTITAGEVVRKTYENWRTWDIVIALGWTMACPFMDIIAGKYGCFPICSVSGVRESGKTSLAQVIMDMCGMTGIPGKNIETTSVPGVERTLDVYSNLPLWIDEYRATPEIQKRWDSYFRSIYNRQGSTKADRTDQTKVISRRIRGGILLTGETPPAESALSSRCVRVEMPEKYTGETWDWINDNRNRFSSIYKQIAARRSESDKFLEITDKARTFLVKRLQDDHQITERYAANYAVVCAAITMFSPEIFVSSDEERAFMDYLVKHVHARQAESDSEHVSVTFVRDLTTLRETDKNLAKQALVVKNIGGIPMVIIHMATAHLAWMQLQRSQGQWASGWSKQSIAKSLLIIGWKPATCTIDGKNWSCIRSPVSAIKDAELRADLEDMASRNFEE